MNLKKLFLVLTGFGLLPLPIAAQTLFVNPVPLSDFSHYKYLEECGGAINRTLSEYSRKHAIYTDTLPYALPDYRTRLPDTVVSIAKNCSKKFDMDTVPLTEIRRWATMLLIADRDMDVHSMYAKLWDTLSVSGYEQHFQEMFDLYRSAIPMRLEALQMLYELAMERIPRDSVLWRLFLENNMILVSRAANDSIASMAHMDSIFNIISSADSAVINRGDIRGFIGMFIFGNLMPLNEAGSLDSLKLSTEAYKNHYSGFWKKLRLPIEYLPNWLNSEFPTLESDFSYRSVNNGSGHEYVEIPKSDTTSYPVQGKVTALAFFDPKCHSFTQADRRNFSYLKTDACRRQMTALRRLKEKFPQIEVVLWAKTYGSLGLYVASDPKEEADTLAKYILGFHKVNGTLAVSNTPTVILPGLDKRRVDLPSENDLRLVSPSGGNAVFDGSEMVLIFDQDRKIIHFWIITGPEYDLVQRKIATVLERGKK